MTPETRSLLRAAATGDSELVKSLIADGTDVNCVSAAGQTPLMLAAGFGHEEIVKVLLEAGAFLWASDELGLKAIDWASNSPKIAQMINELSAPPEGESDSSNGQPKLAPPMAAYKFQAANKPSFDSTPKESTVKLGGLAGAILREKVAKEGLHSEESHDELPPPAPPPMVAVEPLVESVPEIAPQRLETTETPVESIQEDIEPLTEDQVVYFEEQPQGHVERIDELPFDEPGGPARDAGVERFDEVSYVEDRFEEESYEEDQFDENHFDQHRYDEDRFDYVRETAPDPIVEHPLFVPEPAEPPRQNVAERIEYVEEAIPAAVDQMIAESATDVDEPITSKTAKPRVSYPFDDEDLYEDFAASKDDDTLSRAGALATDDTSPTVPQTSPRRESFQSLGLSEPPPARISKVEVNVPSSKAMHGSTRTLIWILVILFLGGGAYAGYRLSSYFLNSNSPQQQTITPKAEPQAQPPESTLGPVKAAPVVGGELAGTELYVPDADYPTAATPQSGKVVVHVRVNQKGIVLSAQATEGNEGLKDAAEAAGKQAAFSPDKLRGLGQVVGGTITYTFVPPTTNTAATAATTPTTEATAPQSALPRVGGPLAGSEVNVPEPDYPAAAKAKKIAGAVTIVVRVNRSGHVVSWRTLDGDDLLRPAALKAAKQATFDPHKLPGSGDVVGTITFTFASQ